MKSLTQYLNETIKKNQLIIKKCNAEANIDNTSEIDEHSIINPPDLSISKIPTLQPNIYREFSPLLKIRYEMFSSWILATHGNWLSLNEMQELWKDDDNSEYITNIKEQLLASKEWWGNDATALFKDERISIFASEEFGNERIYLIWFDDIDEPELWVYDVNGEARYENIEHYLKAYLNDDLENYSKPWILGTLTNVSIENL